MHPLSLNTHMHSPFNLYQYQTILLGYHIRFNFKKVSERTQLARDRRKHMYYISLTLKH